MERPLPEIDILKTTFYVDVQGEQLRQKDNPDNRIPFTAFDQEGDGYTFLYDKEVKNTPGDPENISLQDERYQWVTVPALMELDPVGIALKYDIPLDVLCSDPKLRDLDNEKDDNDEEEDPY